MKPKADFTCAFSIVMLPIAGAFADRVVNCDDVMRRLKAGASPRDLADTTSISIRQVEECQNKADIEAADSMLERQKSDERRKPFRRDESE
jgi:hypothetical protein